MKHLLLFFLLCTSVLAAAEKPNVVLIFVDDLGIGDIGPFGNKVNRTPNLDRLAAQGMKFNSFYATPVCSMSRTCLMTGCYNVRLSVPGVLFPESKIGLNPQETTVAETLKSVGYATACVGKWHLGHRDAFLPTRQGFDSYFGIPYSNDMSLDPVNAVFAKNCVFREGYDETKARAKAVRNVVPLMLGTEVVEYPAEQSSLTRRYTEEAEKFIRSHTTEPFFLYLPHTMVHLPMAASANFKGKSANGLIGDCVEEIDWSVGRIMSLLKELALEEKTLVIFTSDNGAASGTSLPYRGKKGSIFEGGIREPCIMRWPGQIPAGSSCERITGNIDVLPTLAGITGAALPNQKLDGQDISTLLRDPQAAAVRDTHLHFTGQGKLGAIRQGDWKLFTLPAGAGKRGKGAKAAKPELPALALFDLAKDPYETKDVAASHPDVVQRLKQLATEREAAIHQEQRAAGMVE
jgi:arylsulfatase A